MRIGVHCQDFYRTLPYLWVTRRVSYKKQEQLTRREHLSSPTVFFFGGVRIAHLFSFLCCLIVCLYIPCCDVRYYLHIKIMFSSSLLPVVCRRDNTKSCPETLNGVKSNLFQTVTWYSSSKIMSVDLLIYSTFCPIICIYVLSSVLWYSIRFPHKNDVRFVFTFSCLLMLFVFVCI